MKDIIIGIVILLLGFILIDFFYTEKNTCDISTNGYANKPVKCGLLKKQFDLNIELLDRYW